MKIAIHGGMAVGKTTLIKRLEKQFSHIQFSYEDISSVTKKVTCLNLNKNDYNDYLINQELFIKHEIKRYNDLADDLVIMDYSAEEVAFQTLTYPKVFHPEWQCHHIERLADKLIPYYVDRILYLDAHPAVLKQRKEMDFSRKRKSFDSYLHGIHVLKKEWFKTLSHVSFMDTTYMTEDQVFEKTVTWLNTYVLK